MGGPASRENGKKGGRPKGSQSAATITKAEAREAHRIIVLQHMAEMTDAQIKHAKGIKFLVKRSVRGGKFEKVAADDLETALKLQDDGELILEVWDKDPSVQAYTDLMNRALDKPIEHHDVDATVTVKGYKWQD